MKKISKKSLSNINQSFDLFLREEIGPNKKREIERTEFK